MSTLKEMATSVIDDVPTKAVQHPLLAAAVVAIFAGTLVALRRIQYNLYSHPLASFPGPRTAAATSWWKAWVEAIQNRSFVTVLEKLHMKYGLLCLINLIASLILIFYYFFSFRHGSSAGPAGPWNSICVTYQTAGNSANVNPSSGDVVRTGPNEVCDLLTHLSYIIIQRNL